MISTNCDTQVEELNQLLAEARGGMSGKLIHIMIEYLHDGETEMERERERERKTERERERVRERE